MKRSRLFKGEHYKKAFYQAAERLAGLLPGWITGDSEVMGKKYTLRYGCRDHSHRIREHKTQIMGRYLIIVFFFAVLTAAMLAEQLSPGAREEIGSIPRPEFGEKGESTPLEARLRYQDYEFTKSVRLYVAQREPGRREKLAALRSCQAGLESVILGENKDRDHISTPLNLVERDQEYGIIIQWTSSRPDLINEKGEVNLFSARDGQTVVLSADLSLGDVTVTGSYSLKLDTDADQKVYERGMSMRLEDRIKQATASNPSPEMTLPGDLGDGVTVHWFAAQQENNGGPLLVLFLLSITIVYWKRYDRIDREVKAAEASITRDLPEFISKLVLLLNAGLVVSAAFTKIAEDYETLYGTVKTERKGVKDRRYLYEELAEIQKRIEQSNASLIRELRDFSQRCGVREMVRLTAVISDNWNKGSELAEKLEGEGELLWIGRKRKAEERGRLAETKLTFPLMILLIVLIMVTIAPAMLEM